MSDEDKGQGTDGGHDAENSKTAEQLQSELQKLQGQVKSYVSELDVLKKDNAGKDRKIREFVEAQKSEERKNYTVREMQMDLEREFAEKEREFQNQIRELDPQAVEDRTRNLFYHAYSELTMGEEFAVHPQALALCIGPRPKDVAEAKDQLVRIHQTLVKNAEYKSNAGRVGSKPRAAAAERSMAAEEYDKRYESMSWEQRMKGAAELSPEDKMNLLIQQANK